MQLLVYVFIVMTVLFHSHRATAFRGLEGDENVIFAGGSGELGGGDDCVCSEMFSNYYSNSSEWGHYNVDTNATCTNCTFAGGFPHSSSFVNLHININSTLVGSVSFVNCTFNKTFTIYVVYNADAYLSFLSISFENCTFTAAEQSEVLEIDSKSWPGHLNVSISSSYYSSDSLLLAFYNANPGISELHLWDSTLNGKSSSIIVMDAYAWISNCSFVGVTQTIDQGKPLLFVTQVVSVV